MNFKNPEVSDKYRKYSDRRRKRQDTFVISKISLIFYQKFLKTWPRKSRKFLNPGLLTKTSKVFTPRSKTWISNTSKFLSKSRKLSTRKFLNLNVTQKLFFRLTSKKGSYSNIRRKRVLFRRSKV